MAKYRQQLREEVQAEEEEEKSKDDLESTEENTASDETSKEASPSEEPPFNLDDYITLQAAAKQLNINITVLVLWCKTKLLAPIRRPEFNGDFRLEKAAVRKLLEASSLGKNIL